MPASLADDSQGRASQAPAWIVLSTAAFLLLFPVLLLRGMSLDGIIYGTIARNLSLGMGDMWHPHFTDTVYATFFESPPLGYLLASFYFRVFGDQWWVERLYSMTTILPTCAILVLIWRRLVRHMPEAAAYSWLPLALWVSMPAWSWIYRQNYLENTMGIFTALAVYSVLRATQDRRGWVMWTALAAVSIVAAFLTKGPVGLFPLATPAIAWLTLRERSFRAAMLVQVTLLVFVAVFAGLLLSQPGPREYLGWYFEDQILRSLQGTRGAIRQSPLGRFHLLWGLSKDLAVPAAVAGGCVYWLRKRAPSIGAEPRTGRAALFCFLTGASASFPIMISPKQTGYYTAPSWPLFTMALALWALPAVMAISLRVAPRLRRATRWLGALAAVIVVATIALAPLWCGKVYRDGDIIRDAERIATVVGPHATVSIAPELEGEYRLYAYLYRASYISLDVTRAEHTFRIDFATADPAPSGYATIDDRLEVYRILARSAHIARGGDVARD